MNETPVDQLWRTLVTTALLGTDRRDPPEVAGPVGDLVDDATRSGPSERMLTLVAATTAVRRAGVLPGPVAASLDGPDPDERPPCPTAAVQRWRHVVASWPVLEDEWMLTLVEQGWRLAPELVAPALRRHRRDGVRRARVTIAAGPLARWLVDHVAELAPTAGAGLSARDAERVGELPDLPVPPELTGLLDADGGRVGSTIVAGLDDGSFGAPHRAVLVNVVARCAPDGLAAVADALAGVEATSPGRGLASSLGDLATTRRRMLDELVGR